MQQCIFDDVFALLNTGCNVKNARSNKNMNAIIFTMVNVTYLMTYLKPLIKYCGPLSGIQNLA